MGSGRGKKIFSELNTSKLPFNLRVSDLREFGKDIAQNFNVILDNVNEPSLKWCMSTIKKAKVFTLIFHANENNVPIYKEDIAKKLTEYSYKTIATIIDEGVERGYYITLEPSGKSVTDKKIKNIRPSEALVVEFLNWSIDRIVNNSKLIKKYSQK